jgi:chromate transporter
MSKVIAIFVSFFKVGLFGYGGGPSSVPLVEHEVVNVHRWMSTDEFVDTLAVGNSLPGPIIIKLAAFIGYREGGWLGAAAALLGSSLPGIVGMLALGLLLLKYKNHPRMQGLFYGIRPVIVGMLAAFVYSIFASSVSDWKTGAIMVITFALMIFFDVHPILMILAAGLMGMFIL